MIRSVLGITLTLAMACSATAQDVPGLEGALGRLSSPPSAEELAALGTSNPNAYVYFLQDFLTERGIYAGPADGFLSKPTIRAIVSYCEQVGALATCLRGPLLPESIGAVTRAVAAELTPMTAAEQPATAEDDVEAAAVAVEAPVAVAAAQPAKLPEGWRLSDNGGFPTGISAEIVSAGPTEAVIHFSGTAKGDGYFNIQLGPYQRASAGTWTTTVSAVQLSGAGTEGPAQLRTAQFDDKDYIGELSAGVSLPPGDQLQTVLLTGSPKDVATRLLPYVQLWMAEGNKIDATLHIADPSLVRQ